MHEMKTRTKVLLGFIAALAVAMIVGAASYVASRDIRVELVNISEAQFPVARALAGVEEAFRSTNQFLAQQALGPATESVMARGDCGGCHGDGSLFRDRVRGSLEAVERSMRALDGLPPTDAMRRLWPDTRVLLAAWLGDAHDMRDRIAERDGLAGRGGDPARRSDVERRLWARWETLHHRATDIDEAIARLDAAVRADTAASDGAAREAQARQIAVELAVLGVGALVVLVIALAIGRAVDRALAALIGEAAKTSDAALEGRLDVRGDEAVVPREFRPVVRGLNATVELLAAPLRLSCDNVDQLSRGVVPPKVDAGYRGELARMEESWNRLIAILARRSEDVRLLTEGAVAGRLHQRADLGRYQGYHLELIGGVNALLDRFVEPLEAAAHQVDRLARGDVPPPIGKSWPGDLDRLRQNLDACSAAVAALVADAEALALAGAEGRLSARADPARHQGDFRRIVDGIDRTLDGVVGPLHLAAEHLDRLARGDVPPPIAGSWPGDFEGIRANLDRCTAAIRGLSTDAEALVAAAVAGELSVRADPSRHHGAYREIVAGVNRTLDAVLAPIGEASQVLEQLARRDLRARVQGAYRGEHARLEASVNGTAEALQGALTQVAGAVQQVSAAATQIAASSQAVAAGASEQAAALESTTADLESVSGTSRRAAGSAEQANALARSAREAAANGVEAVARMQAAMGRIRESAEGTSQIIKDINDIAFQTNLLALNAAVEAARAGDAGRGFAVVAEEVRSLALRAKEAASKTETLIRQSVREASEGETSSRQVASTLGEIVTGTEQVSEIVSEISAAATEQAAGIGRVGVAVGEMDKVTQQNAASAEQSSSAAGELSGQAEALAAMVGAFELDGERAGPRRLGG